MSHDEQKTTQIESRKLVAGFFITVLIGLAYTEIIPILKNSMRVQDASANDMSLIGVFLCVSMRFFIGNQLHLLDRSINSLPGTVWLYDVMAITIQSVVLIALASLSSVDISKGNDIGFVEVIVGLYALDVSWIGSQWLLGLKFSHWKRPAIPWGWAVLNTVLIVLTLLPAVVVEDVYSRGALLWLLFVNLAAFVVDIVLIDFKQFLGETPGHA
jgi:hypothetical protein